MKIRKTFLAAEFALASAVKANQHIEDECISTDISCIQKFEANLGGRRAKEVQFLKDGSRNLQSECPCSGLTAALVMQSCSSTGPWGEGVLIKDQMDHVFGSHTCIEISGSSPSQADLSSYDIIVVEGSSFFWTTTRNWLNGGGKDALENLAMAGTSVFVNAAPNQNYDGAFPFGATLETYLGSGYLVSNVIVVNPDLLPPSNIAAYSGTSFSHGVIRNYSPLFQPLIQSTNPDTNEPVLVSGRTPYPGIGFVALGAMTTTNFHSPQPDAGYLRENILEHLCQPRHAPIDIKFCSNPNGFNCKAKGVVPITVFGTDNFAVTDIDMGTVQLCLSDESQCLDHTSLRQYSIQDRGSPTDVGASQCTVINNVEQDYLNQDGFPDLELAWEKSDIVETLLDNCCDLTNKAAGPSFIFKAQTNCFDVVSSPVGDSGVDQLFIQNGAGNCDRFLRG